MTAKNMDDIWAMAYDGFVHENLDLDGVVRLLADSGIHPDLALSVASQAETHPVISAAKAWKTRQAILLAE